jgi:NADH:ubiquinone oxidoreductase subunit B-like Fe-S oxidoreductase
VIAVGACAISGGPYIDHPEVHNGVAALLPVDLFVPGCPPHPLTILDGLLALFRRITAQHSTTTDRSLASAGDQTARSAVS